MSISSLSYKISWHPHDPWHTPEEDLYAWHVQQNVNRHPWIWLNPLAPLHTLASCFQNDACLMWMLPKGRVALNQQTHDPAVSITIPLWICTKDRQTFFTLQRTHAQERRAYWHQNTTWHALLERIFLEEKPLCLIDHTRIIFLF